MILDDAILSAWPKWPSYGPREVDAVRRVVKSNQLFAAGEVRCFETDFSTYLGVDFSVGVGNATQGLHLALAALGVGEGDEVAVSNCSWISSASCILMQNAIPVFVDIDPKNFGMDPLKLLEAISPKTKAIIDVNILGYPSNVVEVKKIAERFNIPLIEDASHGPGSSINQKKTGSFGDISVFSLQQRKAISTGDGGIITTNREDLATKISQLRSFGNEELSYNYRMSEFSAALGRIGLEKLDYENNMRQSSALMLSEFLASEDWVRVRLVDGDGVGVYYAIALEINLQDGLCEDLLKEMLGRGVPMRKLFSPLNKHSHFNPKFKPARGLPWNHPNYDGSMQNVQYKDLNFPICEEFCNGRVFELYVHPGTDDLHLKAFAKTLKELYFKLSPDESSRRPNWV